MNKQSTPKETKSDSRCGADSAKASAVRLRAAGAATVLLVSVGLLIYSSLARAQQPVLRITSLGTNQFLITVTNGFSTTNYTLFAAPALANTNYPWQVWGYGDVGATNFLVDGADWSVGIFKVLVGIDQDGDGWPEWQDAQPLNPSVGILSVTIDSPTNGLVFQ